MNGHDEKGMKELLQAALPPVDPGAEPGRDLWPEVLKRLDSAPAAPPWFDWALAAGVGLVLAAFPTAIPMILYCL